jgi:hypothetical protein
LAAQKVPEDAHQVLRGRLDAGRKRGIVVDEGVVEAREDLLPDHALELVQVDDHARPRIDRTADRHLQGVRVPVDGRERPEMRPVLRVGPLGTRVAVRGRERESPGDGDRGRAWLAHGLSGLTVV